jgi:hypothetical protein
MRLICLVNGYITVIMESVLPSKEWQEIFIVHEKTAIK